MFYTATAPENWELATVVEIFKGKGSHSNPEMYRPISLLNTVYKLFARILQTRIAKDMDHLLRKTQYGFRADRSCIQPLHILHRLQEKALAKEGPFYMLLMDLGKGLQQSHPPPSSTTP